MAAVIGNAAGDVRSICGGPAPETDWVRAQAAPARDLGCLAAQSPQALQTYLALVVVPPGAGPDQQISGQHLFSAPAQARSAHHHSARPARRRARASGAGCVA